MKQQTGQRKHRLFYISKPGIIFVLLALCIVAAHTVVAQELPTYPLLEKELDPTSPKPTTHHARTNTGSSVDHLTRQYSTDNPGLTVNVPGGYLTVNTVFENGHWSLGPARVGLDGKAAEWSGLSVHVLQAENQADGKEEILTAIIKDGRYTYNLPEANVALKTQYDADGHLMDERYVYVGEQVFVHEQFRIRPTAEGGYRWQDKYGNWLRYDSEGRMTGQGDRRGTLYTALYDIHHTLLGYADRNDTPVIWIDYNADGRIAAARDRSGRTVEYAYNADGRLETVTDVASVLNQDGEGYAFEFGYDKAKKEYYAMARHTSGEIREYWYDDAGDTIRIDVNGDTIQTLVKDGNALILTNEWDEQTRQEYDEWDNLVNVVHPNGEMSTYHYDRSAYHRMSSKNECGIITEYT